MIAGDAPVKWQEWPNQVGNNSGNIALFAR